MARKRDIKAPLVVSTQLAVGDASKILVAAPGAGLAIRVFKIIPSVLTAAAQAIQVGVNAGGITQQLLAIAASVTLATIFDSDEGYRLPANTALSAVPAAAGPAVNFVVEYVIESV